MKYIIKPDLQKNLLYVWFSGHIDEQEAARLGKEFVQALQKLRPGFILISDLSDAVPASPQAMESLKHSQLAIAEYGAKKVIRIIGNIVGTAQVKRMQRESGADYDVVQVTSVEEAERLLKEAGIEFQLKR